MIDVVRIWACTACEYVASSRVAAITHERDWGHRCRLLELKRRERKAAGGFEVQWSTDWRPE